MGQFLLDQYSLLHTAVGIIAYFWNVPFWIGIAIHALFEWAENTQIGIKYVNKLFVEPGFFGLQWPGGKREPDSLLNQFGDTVVFGIGWLIAQMLDRVGVQKGWYSGHLVTPA